MANDWFDEETFLKGNANPDFIGAKFAELIRDLMRAVASNSPSSEAYRAAKQMDYIAELLAHAQERLSFQFLFEKALGEFETPNGNRPELPIDEATLNAARRGIKYLVERSCTDSAANARASRRQHEFLSAIEAINDVREHSRRKYHSRKGDIIF